MACPLPRRGRLSASRSESAFAAVSSLAKSASVAAALLPARLVAQKLARHHLQLREEPVGVDAPLPRLDHGQLLAHPRDLAAQLASARPRGRRSCRLPPRPWRAPPGPGRTRIGVARAAPGQLALGEAERGPSSARAPPRAAAMLLSSRLASTAYAKMYSLAEARSRPERLSSSMFTACR